ncbi:MAG: leucine-rich repeat domain-containing protein [Oscillospiraceae bacterium]|nr:leucine-rich repeat domain-containing protein [Oscillospiraceae bacterium]
MKKRVFTITLVLVLLANTAGILPFRLGDGLAIIAEANITTGDFIHVNYAGYYDEYGDRITMPGTVITGYIGTGGNLTLPRSINNRVVFGIENSAFEGINSIRTISLPNALVGIGGGAFRNCTNMTSVNIPSSVNWISAEAFMGCTRLLSINIPWRVKTVDNSLLEDCTRLVVARLNSGTETINSRAFANCPNMRALLIPASVTTIDPLIFGDYFPENITIYSPEGSAAQTFAIQNAIPHVIANEANFNLIMSRYMSIVENHDFIDEDEPTDGRTLNVVIRDENFNFISDITVATRDNFDGIQIYDSAVSNENGRAKLTVPEDYEGERIQLVAWARGDSLSQPPIIVRTVEVDELHVTQNITIHDKSNEYLESATVNGNCVLYQAGKVNIGDPNKPTARFDFIYNDPQGRIPMEVEVSNNRETWFSSVGCFSEEKDVPSSKPAIFNVIVVIFASCLIESGNLRLFSSLRFSRFNSKTNPPKTGVSSGNGIGIVFNSSNIFPIFVGGAKS